MARQWRPANTAASSETIGAVAPGVRTGTDGRRERRKRVYDPAGRNIRSVWTIATQPYPGAHFATFPRSS